MGAMLEPELTEAASGRQGLSQAETIHQDLSSSSKGGMRCFEQRIKDNIIPENAGIKKYKIDFS